MAEHTLYIDCDRAVPVTSKTDSTRKVLPRFVQGDTLNLKIYLLQGFNRSASYTQIPVAGITLEAALGTRVGNSSTLYAAQYSWTPSTDLADPYWEATLALNTAAIDSLVGSDEKDNAYFEIKYFKSAVPTTILSEQVQVWAAVIKAASVVPVAEPTPLSAEVANATYQPIEELQLPTVAYDSETGKRCRLYIDSEGAFHADPIP